ncbi:MAG: hypothetical protein R2879_02055 [Saprospiraceae bacterium]
MKYTFLFCLLAFFLQNNAIGQEKLLMLSEPKKKEAIKSTLNSYLNYTKTKNYEKLLDYIHPKLYDIVSKEVLLQEFKKMDSDENMKISFGNATIKDVSDLVRVGKRYFSLVFYQFEMTMAFKDKSMAEVMESNFKNVFGEKNVTLNKEKGSLDIITHKSLFAIEDPELDGWKVIENNPEQRFILESIMPKSVIEHFKTYYPNGN